MKNPSDIPNHLLPHCQDCEEEKGNIHHGRYNEPGAKGKDIYDISNKVKSHIKDLKNS